MTRYFLCVCLLILTIGCDKDDNTESANQDAWSINESIVFNSSISNILVDNVNNVMYCDGLTFKESSSSLVRIDNSGWEQVGSSIGAPIYDMALYKDRMYMAGSSLNLGNIGYHKLLYWDNEKWNVGFDPESGWGMSLEIHNGDLYFGSSGLHKLDGNNWKTLSGEYTDTPHQLLSFNNQMYGVIDDSKFKVAKWDFASNKWIGISQETPNVINCIIGVNNEIYIGSRFYEKNSSYLINGIAKFDGDKWEDISYNLKSDNILSGEVYALASYKGQIYAATAYKEQKNNNQIIDKYVVLRLENDQWQQVGDEFDHDVTCFGVFNGLLYAGGRFAGGLATLEM